MNDSISNGVIIIMVLSRIIGLIGWSVLFLILMEVVVCRDARTVDTVKILNTNLKVRIRMFKRSIKSLFYRASLILFACTIFAMISLISDLWLGRLPRFPYTWTIVSLTLPVGIIFLYVYLGHQLTWFSKFKLFIKDQHP